jgi:hypothetical protein
MITSLVDAGKWPSNRFVTPSTETSVVHDGICRGTALHEATLRPPEVHISPVDGRSGEEHAGDCDGPASPEFFPGVVVRKKRGVQPVAWIDDQGSEPVLVARIVWLPVLSFVSAASGCYWWRKTHSSSDGELESEHSALSDSKSFSSSMMTKCLTRGVESKGFAK